MLLCIDWKSSFHMLAAFIRSMAEGTGYLDRSLTTVMPGIQPRLRHGEVAPTQLRNSTVQQKRGVHLDYPSTQGVSCLPGSAKKKVEIVQSCFEKLREYTPGLQSLVFRPSASPPRRRIRFSRDLRCWKYRTPHHDAQHPISIIIILIIITECFKQRRYV
ncbi:hypothetical protein LZ30DRAFT_163163 [Colletotrichum cereale]|nr:hypothetical protein LZ30DRAFT_163163 [Colletotrichum cereale]